MFSTPVMMIDPYGEQFHCSLTVNGPVDNRTDILMNDFDRAGMDFQFEMVNRRFPVFRIVCRTSEEIEKVLDIVLEVDDRTIILTTQAEKFGDIPIGTMGLLVQGHHLAAIR